MTDFAPRRFRANRERVGLSRFALAMRVGVTPDTIKAYERGEHSPKASTLGRCADAFGCSVADFFTESTSGIAA